MNYNGGKGASGVHQQIINKMPKHRVYIETHLGGGNILIRKKKSECTIAIEIDTASLEKFKRYSIAKDDDTISLINGKCEEFLESYNFKGDEVVYVDPPYVFETRKSKKDLYKYEYNDNDHINLIKILDELPCFVMLSGYESELYAKLLNRDKWNLFTFNAMTRKGVRTEALWCNFNPDDYIKHDYSYIGSGFRERERIKRKSDRWIKNLEKLPADERNFILSNMTENFGLELANHF
ncbi:MAG: DNA adenine methylase [Thiotrichales bacterium]|nr:DNA adenine methylase [Thiotrichales bacterium]